MTATSMCQCDGTDHEATADCPRQLGLDAIKARCEAGLNGPHYGGEHVYIGDGDQLGGWVCMGCGTPIESEECPDHCSNADVLALVAEVERLRELMAGGERS